MKRIGITTTVPAEFIFAAGAVPVDLNNVFVSDTSPAAMVEKAELDGLPRAICGWIKGMYGAAIATRPDCIIAVSDGDCSHTRTLLEILGDEGVPAFPFAYPYDRDYSILRNRMEILAGSLCVSFQDGVRAMERMDAVRCKLHRIDEMTWRDDRVTGLENHLFLVTASDMDGEIERFERRVDAFLEEIKHRPALPQGIRLALIGVPPIFTDLYQFLETRGARVVFNEVQRQFTFPFDTDDLVERYRRYTYPYDVFGRIEDIRRETARREVDGIIHYVQSFCHRQMEDLLFRKHLGAFPILTVEGDSPGPLDARTRLRLESFCEMLSAKKVSAGAAL